MAQTACLRTHWHAAQGLTIPRGAVGIAVAAPAGEDRSLQAVQWQVQWSAWPILLQALGAAVASMRLGAQLDSIPEPHVRGVVAAL